MTPNPTGCRQFRLQLLSPGSAIVVLMLVLAELALHVDPVRRLLPPPNPYYDGGVETRLQALEVVLEEYGRVDILFVGSSVVRTNFQPLVFDREIAERTGIEIVSFNAGLSGLPPDPVQFYLEHLWLERVSPRIVLQGVRYSELQDVRTAATFEPFRAGLFEPRWLRGSRVDEIELFLLQHVRLFYYRGALTETLRSFQWPPNRPRGFPIDSRGYNATELLLEEIRARGLLDETAYTDEPTLESFRTGLAALSRAAEACRARGVEYVVVNMPEHSDKFLSEPGGRERYAVYIQVLQVFAEERGILFIDVTEGDVAAYADDSLFSDYHHMSPLGAEQFTRALAVYLSQEIEAMAVGLTSAPASGSSW